MIQIVIVLQQTVYDMVTMSIDIIPVINNYITPFMSFDKSIPRIITETATIITEYLENKPKVSLNNQLFKIYNRMLD